MAPPVVRIDGGRIVEADIGDGVVVDRSRRAGEGAGRADLHAVLGLERGLGADDLVVVDIDGQPAAIGEDAGLLEIADRRILDLHVIAAGRAAMGLVVAGDDDRVVALVAGGFASVQLAHIGDRDAVDVGVGVDHIDAGEVVGAGR